MNAAQDVCRLYLFASMILSCGCALTSDARYELTQTLRARSAWRNFDKGLLFSSHSSDYACGWKAGFRSVLVGGDGRPPVVPPRRYWNPAIVHGCNISRQQDWMKGFAVGAVAARSHSGQHYIRPFFSACCSGTYQSNFVGTGPAPSPIQKIHSIPAVDLHAVDAQPACRIRLLGMEPIDTVEPVPENPWAIPIAPDLKLPGVNATRVLSPEPAFEDSLGDKR